MLAEILELFEYNRWANARTLSVTAQLSPEDLMRDLRSSFPSIRDTLVHIVGAEWIWLQRWQGTSPTSAPPASQFLDHAAIVARLQAVQAEQQQLLNSLTESALAEVIAYRNLKGEPFAQPLYKLMRHLVNHSTYHRGQVTTMLRQLNAPAVATDLVLFYREEFVEQPLPQA